LFDQLVVERHAQAFQFRQRDYHWTSSLRVSLNRLEQPLKKYLAPFLGGSRATTQKTTVLW